MKLRTWTGSCHCGAVRFEVDANPADEKILDCNCSICVRKGILHLIVPPERFRLISGEGALSTYTFGTGEAKHLFCRFCGIHPFYRPRSHPGWYDVNLRCLDELNPSVWTIEPFNGRDWENNINAINPSFKD